MKLPTQRYVYDLRKYYRLPAIQASLSLVLSVFLIAFFVAFALRPTIVSIVTLKTTITESKKTLQQLETKASSLQKAAVQLESMKPLLPSLNATIPNDGAGYLPLNLAIEALAYQTKTKLENESMGATLLFSRILAPFAADKNQTIVELPFSLRITGNYPNVSLFLTKLLSMERIIMVESIAITRESEKKSVDAGVALNLSGSAYYLADQVQLQRAMPDEKGKK